MYWFISFIWYSQNSIIYISMLIFLGPFDSVSSRAVLLPLTSIYKDSHNIMHLLFGSFLHITCAIASYFLSPKKRIKWTDLTSSQSEKRHYK